MATIVVEGPIGVGKTSLARYLASELDARMVLEVVEENPFLPGFYREPERFAFQAQVFFLLSRFRQQMALAQEALFHR
ncbi:MAG: deoxynucleoside kinase, partial [Deinococcales bacterium]